VDFLVSPLDLVRLLLDAGEADYLPANAIASAAPAKEICRRGDRNEEYEERRTKLLRDANVK